MASSPLDFQHGGDHYKKMKIQPIEYALANEMDACQYSVLKYISRHKTAEGVLDLQKAIHFIQFALKYQYNVNCVVSYGDEKPEEPKPEEPLFSPIMSFNDKEPTQLAIVSAYPSNPIEEKKPKDENIPPFLEPEKEVLPKWEVVPVYDSSQEGKIVGYRVGTKQEHGVWFFIRHYLTDDMTDSPSLNWCQNAAERQAEEFNFERRTCESFSGYHQQGNREIRVSSKDEETTEERTN